LRYHGSIWPVSPHWPASDLPRDTTAPCEKPDVRRTRFHDLRHCCVSLPYRRALPLENIQVRLGHSSPTVTKVICIDMAEDVLRMPSTDTTACSVSRTKSDDRYAWRGGHDRLSRWLRAESLCQGQRLGGIIAPVQTVHALVL